LLGDLIGEFKGKNTVYRVLSDGKIETSGQGAGKFLGTDAFVMFTNVSVTIPNGVYVGETNSIISTLEGDSVIMKGNAVAYPSEKGGISRGASTQMTQSQKLLRLNKVICLHEYETDMENNWVGKIWEWV
jgi:hypothetical protein